MTTATKIFLSLLIVIAGVAIYGAYQYPVQVANFASTAGTTFSNAKIAAVVMTPSSATATSSSVYNSDSSDRIIDSAFVSCYPASGSVFAQTGAGLANWIWTAATSSTAAPATLANTNYALNAPVATSTTNDSYVATSTYQNTITRRWAAGSYLTFQPNATSSTATNCTVGVYYHGT